MNRGLTITTLGELAFQQNGEAVTGFPSRKTEALLVYLAVERGYSHRRESLFTLLWPGMPERSARHNLRQLLYTLRRLFPNVAAHEAGEGVPLLLVDRQTVEVNPQAVVDVDVHRLDRILEGTRGHNHLSLAGCEACPQALEGAVALYTGEFLSGFYLEDSNAFEDWAVANRTAYRHKVLDMLETLTGIYVQRGEYRQARTHAERQLTIDPLREGACRQLMEVLSRSGRRSEALRQYQECARRLEEELGVAPERETTELYERIRVGDLQPAGEKESAPGVATATPARASGEALPWLSTPSAPSVRADLRHNLPPQATPFVGRRKVLDEIAALLENPDCRLLTLLGPGGVGKTRLAIQAGSEHVDIFPHGVFYVSLAALRSPKSIVPAIADSLGLVFHEGGEPPKRILLDYLYGRRLLLVLDNFEHLVEGAGLLGEISAQAPGVKMLVTSRERLNLQAEWVLEVQGMSFPEPVVSGWSEEVIEGLKRYSSVQLFLQSAGRVQVGFSIKDTDYPAVARITQLAEGVPLELELAAAWVNVLSCEEIAAEIERSFDFLASSRPDLPERQRSVRAIFDHSWKLLGEREKHAFPRLSVFQGKFTRQAAEEITGSSLHDLMSLVNKSLLQHTAESGFEMHELLRQYAAEKLEENPEAHEQVHERFSAYFCTALKEWGAKLKGPQQSQALKEIEANLENARAAWDWAAAHRRVAQLDEALEGACLFFLRQSRYEEGNDLCQAATGALRELTSGDTWSVFCRLLAWQAYYSQSEGRREIAKELVQESWDLLERHASEPQQALEEWALVSMVDAYIFFLEGDMDASIRSYEQSLALYKQAGDDWMCSYIYTDMATLVWVKGEVEKARGLYEESLKLRRAIGDPFSLAASLSLLGRYYAYGMGEFMKAERLLQESADLFMGLGDPVSERRALVCEEMIANIRGEFSTVLEIRRKQVPILEGIGSAIELGELYIFMGETCHHLGDYPQAERLGRKGLAILDKIDSDYYQAWARWFLGLTLLGTGEYVEARELLEESVMRYRQENRKGRVGSSLVPLSTAELALGEREEAWKLAREGLELIVALRTFTMLFYALASIALLLADQGEILQAVELYALVSRYPFVAKSRWFAHVYGRPIEEAARGLDPEEVEAARVRGQALDMWTTAEDLLVELGG